MENIKGARLKENVFSLLESGEVRISFGQAAKLIGSDYIPDFSRFPPVFENEPELKSYCLENKLIYRFVKSSIYLSKQAQQP